MGSEVDWKFQSVSQVSICPATVSFLLLSIKFNDSDSNFSVWQPGLKGRSVKEPQGKILGGSSAINGQAFIAPSQADIDGWAKFGNKGWDWNGLLPYYKKSYTLISPPDQETKDHLGIDWINEEYRGTS